MKPLRKGIVCLIDILDYCSNHENNEICTEAICQGLFGQIEFKIADVYEKINHSRPSSVAWEVPVSAIKQPSLPFQPNGEQLYYYPCLPQVNQVTLNT